MARPIGGVLRDAYTRHFYRLLRFGVVGVSGALIQMGLLVLLVERAGIHHLIAAAIASEVSIVTNFTMNDRWTFADLQPGGSWLQRLLKYNGVALAGTAVSLAVLALLSDVFGLYYLVANVIALGAATLSNYVLNVRFTWARRRGGVEEDPLSV